MDRSSEQYATIGVIRDTVTEAQPTASAVSWGAILAGAAAAAALSLILVILGTGLGLSAVSPWAHDGASPTTLGVSAILWLTLTQLVAAAMGGYLTGRLRTRWLGVHTDEVYFRDTAHGFLAWAIATLATATLLTSIIGSIVGGGVKAGASVAGDVASTAIAASAGGAAAAGADGAVLDYKAGPLDYFVDSLFRKTPNTVTATPPLPGEVNAGADSSIPAFGGTVSGSAPTSVLDESVPRSVDSTDSISSMPLPEVGRIYMNGLRAGALPEEDVQYVGQLVAQRTGLTQQEAEARVRKAYARIQTTLQNAELSAKEAADKARKTSVYTALWLFISLLIGAFVASAAATFGGRARDF